MIAFKPYPPWTAESPVPKGHMVKKWEQMFKTEVDRNFTML